MQWINIAGVYKTLGNLSIKTDYVTPACILFFEGTCSPGVHVLALPTGHT